MRGISFGEPPHQRRAFVRQMQRIGTAVGRDRLALGEPAALQRVEKRHQIGALDIERAADLRLPQARIALDHDQHGILRGADVELRIAAPEILKHRQLRAPQHVADKVGQRPKVDVRRAIVCAVRHRCVARRVWSATARFCSFGNVLRSIWKRCTTDSEKRARAKARDGKNRPRTRADWDTLALFSRVVRLYETPVLQTCLSGRN
jgi:hypothetical protein